MVSFWYSSAGFSCRRRCWWWWWRRRYDRQSAGLGLNSIQFSLLLWPWRHTQMLLFLWWYNNNNNNNYKLLGNLFLFLFLCFLISGRSRRNKTSKVFAPTTLATAAIIMYHSSLNATCTVIISLPFNIISHVLGFGPNMWEASLDLHVVTVVQSCCRCWLAQVRKPEEHFEGAFLVTSSMLWLLQKDFYFYFYFHFADSSKQIPSTTHWPVQEVNLDLASHHFPLVQMLLIVIIIVSVIIWRFNKWFLLLL